MHLTPNTADFESAPAEINYEGLYSDLRQDAITLGSELNVPYELYDPTMKLVGMIKDYDPQIACESLKGLRLALGVAKSIEEFYGVEVDKAAVWAGFILHDVGKIMLPHSLNDKSHEGIEWTEFDAIKMSQHVEIGYYIAKEFELPDIVARPIAESHGKQRHKPYGLNPVLSPAELHVRACIAIADPADAMLNRTNTFNQHMLPDERLTWVREQIGFVCEDYQNNGSALAEHISQNVEAELFAIVA